MKMKEDELNKILDRSPAEVDCRNEKEYKECRGEVLKAMEYVSDKISTAERKGQKNLVNEHDVTFEKLKNHMYRLDAARDLVEARGDHNESFQFGNEFQGSSGLPGSRGGSDVQVWESVSGKNKGKEIRVLGKRARLQDQVEEKPSSDMTWNNYMRARIAGHTGDHSIMGPKNFMSTTSDSSLVPTPLSAQVIDLARNKSRIFQAGATVFEMLSKTETIARVTGDPTAQWKPENASHTSSDVTTEPLTFTAKTLIASVKMSVELSEDAPNGTAVVENSIAEQLALEMDRVGLVGSGDGAQPQGIFGYTGVQEHAVSAALANYDPFSIAYQKILEANGMPTGIIYAPRTWGSLDRLKDKQDQPLTAPASYANLDKYQTNQVPIDLGEGDDESIAFVGDFSQLMVGVRTSLRMEITRVASDSTNSAWEDLQVWVRAYMRADFQLAKPDHFCVLTGIEPEEA